MCVYVLGCAGVGEECVGLRQGSGRLGWCYVCLSCEFGLFV